MQALLTGLEAAVDSHTEAALLEAAVRSYHNLSANDSLWQHLAASAIDRLIQRWTHTLDSYLEEAVSVSIVQHLVQFHSNFVALKPSLFFFLFFLFMT